MAKSTFRCRLITPESQVCDDPAVGAVIPAWDGLIGVLPNRAPMVMQMGIGELRIDFPDSGTVRGGSRSFFVDDGFVQMVDNELTILAASAIAAEKLNESEAQAELSAANARKTDGLAAADADRIRAARTRAAVKLTLARSVRGRGGI